MAKYLVIFKVAVTGLPEVSTERTYDCDPNDLNDKISNTKNRLQNIASRKFEDDEDMIAGVSVVQIFNL